MANIMGGTVDAIQNFKQLNEAMFGFIASGQLTTLRSADLKPLEAKMEALSLKSSGAESENWRTACDKTFEMLTVMAGLNDKLAAANDEPGQRAEREAAIAARDRRQIKELGLSASQVRGDYAAHDKLQALERRTQALVSSRESSEIKNSRQKCQDFSTALQNFVAARAVFEEYAKLDQEPGLGLSQREKQYPMMLRQIRQLEDRTHQQLRDTPLDPVFNVARILGSAFAGLLEKIEEAGRLLKEDLTTRKMGVMVAAEAAAVAPCFMGIDEAIESAGAAAAAARATSSAEGATPKPSAASRLAAASKGAREDMQRAARADEHAAHVIAGRPSVYVGKKPIGSSTPPAATSQIKPQEAGGGSPESTKKRDESRRWR